MGWHEAGYLALSMFGNDSGSERNSANLEKSTCGAKYVNTAYVPILKKVYYLDKFYNIFDAQVTVIESIRGRSEPTPSF